MSTAGQARPAGLAAGGDAARWPSGTLALWTSPSSGSSSGAGWPSNVSTRACAGGMRPGGPRSPKPCGATSRPGARRPSAGSACCPTPARPSSSGWPARLGGARRGRPGPGRAVQRRGGGPRRRGRGAPSGPRTDSLLGGQAAPAERSRPDRRRAAGRRHAGARRAVARGRAEAAGAGSGRSTGRSAALAAILTAAELASTPSGVAAMPMPPWHWLEWRQCPPVSWSLGIAVSARSRPGRPWRRPRRRAALGRRVTSRRSTRLPSEAGPAADARRRERRRAGPRAEPRRATEARTAPGAPRTVAADVGRLAHAPRGAAAAPAPEAGAGLDRQRHGGEAADVGLRDDAAAPSSARRRWRLDLADRRGDGPHRAGRPCAAEPETARPASRRRGRRRRRSSWSLGVASSAVAVALAPCAPRQRAARVRRRGPSVATATARRRRRDRPGPGAADVVDARRRASYAAPSGAFTRRARRHRAVLGDGRRRRHRQGGVDRDDDGRPVAVARRRHRSVMRVAASDVR